jgi:hypothetical protein
MNYVGTDLSRRHPSGRPDGVDSTRSRAVRRRHGDAPDAVGRGEASPHAHARIVSVVKSGRSSCQACAVSAEDFPDILSEEAFVSEGP